MKRRRFLSLLGAGVAAPMLPVPSVAAAASAAPSQAAVHGAILHAQSSRYVSAWGLSKVLNVSTTQASELMRHLADRGVIAPMRGARLSSQWAASRIHTPILARTKAAKSSATPEKPNRHRDPNLKLGAETDHMMRYLRDLSARYFAAKAAIPA